MGRENGQQNLNENSYRIFMASAVIWKMRGRWDHSIEMDLREFICEGGRWVKLFRFRFRVSLFY
jgi:hypothetical protein